VDLPTFPPFALFDPALGMTTVVPWMDPTRPAKANPDLLIQSIERFGVTNVFGSPALLRVLGGHAKRQGRILANVRRVISAGAAVPLDAAQDMRAALPPGGKVFSGYGATECLPVSCVELGELDETVIAQTRAGHGICVGKPIAPNRVAVMPVRDLPEDRLPEDELLPTGVAGEFVVHGPTTTDAYWQRDAQTRLAKCTDGEGRVWHRMGDAGYLDEHGRLWYCGRKSQRLELGGRTLFPDQVEAYFNTHPEVFRTALVAAAGKAVLCVETAERPARQRRERIRTDLLQMARSHGQFDVIDAVLFHRAFPVDIRHNSKIGREKLASWAEGQLS
ncbi:MAG: AMP-binding protein, partial [Xanthomonadales bacterium]|nr:AMP-binding protein [Xanthomonadales bacterium]